MSVACRLYVGFVSGFLLQLGISDQLGQDLNVLELLNSEFKDVLQLIVGLIVRSIFLQEVNHVFAEFGGLLHGGRLLVDKGLGRSRSLVDGVAVGEQI